VGEETAIQWTDSTFNPWTGCVKVAPECANCYAEMWAKRSGLVKWGSNVDRRRTSASNWKKPLDWNRKAEADGVRRKVFVASLADVFEDRPELVEWREDLWNLISVCDALDWLLLTKRPENIPYMIPWDHTPWSHVWLGTSAGTQATAERNIPLLLRAPAALHFLSCEPLLEPVTLDVFDRTDGCHWLTGIDEDYPEEGVGTKLDWVIVGSESGHRARPMQEAWVRNIRDECLAADVPFFYKQRLDANGNKLSLPLLDGQRYAQFPEVECPSP
jgi:protein gp37